MKILVADDDRTSRLMIQYMLKGSGYDVMTACDGTEAVAMLSSPDAPRLALVDWMMPGLNGPDVCKAIRRGCGRPYTYLLLLTARDTKDDLVLGLQSGADDYITKPFHPEELRARLRTGERILRLEDSLIQARDEMEYRATHDALTGLLNRGAAVSALKAALRDAANSGEAVTVVLCDVDHFKSINDSHGHPAGDEVLREVARRIVAEMGPNDAAGRFGGEEFLLVLRGRDPWTAMERVAAVRAGIADKMMTVPGKGLSVTISIGALAVSPEVAFDVDEALRGADELLYRAKREGRNRVVSDELGARRAELADGSHARSRSGETVSRRMERSGVVAVARPVLEAA